MNKIALLLSLTLTYLSQAQIIIKDIGCQTGNTTPYKLDLNNDGIKDYWFGSKNGSGLDCSMYVVGRNGNKIEIESGVDANRLEAGNAIGNNIWGDSARLAYAVGSTNTTGNFGDGSSVGYIGIKFFDNGQVRYGWIQLQVFYGGMYVCWGAYDSQGGAMKAGQYFYTGINEQSMQDQNLFWNGTDLVTNCIHESECSLLTMNGQIVHSWRVPEGLANWKLTDLPRGLYLATLQDGQQRIYRKKILID
ncbi:MAG: hypothetical protein U0T84_13860 [Chitinophagales bacterium]